MACRLAVAAPHASARTLTMSARLERQIAGIGLNTLTPLGQVNTGRPSKSNREDQVRAARRRQTSVRRHQPPQFFEPVLHEDQVRRCADRGGGFATADDHKLSIGCDVVPGDSHGWARALATRTVPAGARRRASSRTGLQRQTSADHPRLRRTVRGRHGTRADARRRRSRSVAGLRAPDIAPRRSPTDQRRGIGKPLTARLERGPMACRRLRALLRLTGARWRSARSCSCSTPP